MPRPAVLLPLVGLLVAACAPSGSAEVAQGGTSGQPVVESPSTSAGVPPQDGAASSSWLEPVGGDVGSGGTREEYLRSVQPYSLPEWAHTLAGRQGLADSLALAAQLNPFYQSGDFDGDGQLDVAVLVSRRATGEIGILLLHAGTGQSVLLGAGREFGNGGESFDWMTNWSVRPRQEGGWRGDVLEVLKLESAGALIVWNGSAYEWQQRGD